MGLPEPGQAEGGLGLGLALVALAHWPGLTGMSVGGSGPSGGAGPTRWSKGGTQNQGQEELIRRQPRRARGHNRAEGPPGTAPSLPRINREKGEGRGSSLEEEGCPSCLDGHLLSKSGRQDTLVAWSLLSASHRMVVASYVLVHSSHTEDGWDERKRKILFIRKSKGGSIFRGLVLSPFL